MKILALLLPLLVQSAPRAAWDIAPRWDCQATQLRICQDLGESCELSENDARFRIDFVNNRFHVGDDDPGASAGETIAVRYFWPGGDYSDGFTKIAFDTGDTLSLETAPVEGTKDIYAMLMTRADPASQYSFFGSCRPAK